VLDTADIGHRVVIRRRTGGVPGLTDVLGILLAADPDHLVVRAHDGTEHDIARELVVASKRVPPRPTRHSEIVALELAGDEAWPAPVRERLGEWILRSAQGFSTRANSALPIGDPGRPVEAAVEACRAWYVARGLRPRIAVPLPLCRGVAQLLADRGWRAQPDVLVQTARLADVTRWPAPDLPQVDLVDAPSADLLAIVGARKQSLPDAAHHVLTAVAQLRFAENRDQDGSLVAIARGAIVGAILHVGLVEVMPQARRRGLARHLTVALARWAQDEGATRSMLQVEEHNTAAVALYARMGYTTHHRYVAYND
jgi:N-acetylglutamate synthase